jgi:hypothetical protein
MRTWIKRFARILSVAAFFGVFLVGINPDDPLNTTNALWAAAKGFAAFSIFWLAGYILGDIIFKGVIETLNKEEIPAFEGGLVQRLRDEQETLDPDTGALEPKEAAKAFGDRERRKREEADLAADELAKKAEASRRAK